jgi:hypothetical protein
VPHPEQHTKASLGSEGPLSRPPAGSGLPVSTQGQDSAKRRVTESVSNSRRAVGAPGPCKVTRGFHTELGRPCIHRRSRKQIKQHLLMGDDRSLHEALKSPCGNAAAPS